MNYTVRKGLGSILGNLTRQMLLTQWPSVRPIGYAVGDKSTVISAGSNVVEAMVELSSSISSLRYRSDMEMGDIRCVEFEAPVIKAGDLSQNGIEVIGNLDKEILHFVGSPLVLKVYFRCGYGSFSTYENRRFLEKESLFENNVITINSRHCDVSDISFSVEPLNEDYETLSISLSDSLGRDEHSMVKESFNILFDQIENSVLI